MLKRTSLSGLLIMLLLMTLTGACASSSYLLPTLKNRTLRLKADGTGFWYQYKKYYRCRLIFDCYDMVRDEYLFNDADKMKELAAMGFKLSVRK